MISNRYLFGDGFETQVLCVFEACFPDGVFNRRSKDRDAKFGSDFAFLFNRVVSRVMELI